MAQSDDGEQSEVPGGLAVGGTATYVEQTQETEEWHVLNVVQVAPGETNVSKFIHF